MLILFLVYFDLVLFIEPHHYAKPICVQEYKKTQLPRLFFANFAQFDQLTKYPLYFVSKITIFKYDVLIEKVLSL